MNKKEDKKIIVFKKEGNEKKEKNKEEVLNKEKIKEALIKKAMGFSHNEVVEEYVMDQDGEIKLTKRKVTKKFSPPDIPAAKMLLEEFEDKFDIESMTEEELEQEKQRLLKELKDL